MRLLIQRVRRASVTIDGTLHSSIGAGLLLLVGIEEADTQEDIDYLAGKASRLRVFDDEAGVMNLDVRQTAGELLVVSQFTLHASTRKGNRPSYFRAAGEAFALMGAADPAPGNPNAQRQEQEGVPGAGR